VIELVQLTMPAKNRVMLPDKGARSDSEKGGGEKTNGNRRDRRRREAR